jgi:hypothetical protein
VSISAIFFKTSRAPIRFSMSAAFLCSTFTTPDPIVPNPISPTLISFLFILVHPFRVRSLLSIRYRPRRHGQAPACRKEACLPQAGRSHLTVPVGRHLPTRVGISIGGSPAAEMTSRRLSNQTLEGYHTFTRFSTTASTLRVPGLSMFLPVDFSQSFPIQVDHSTAF